MKRFDIFMTSQNYPLLSKGKYFLWMDRAAVDSKKMCKSGTYTSNYKE